MKFHCKFLEEIVILSDGRITTCCMDPLGENAYGSIHDGDYDSWVHKYADKVARIMADPESTPRCAACYAKAAAAPDKGSIYQKTSPEKELVEKTLAQSAQGPKRAVIELSSICNLKCRGCMQYRSNIPDTREQPLMDMDPLMSWMRGSKAAIEKIRLYNYGETFVHPRAIEFISFLKGLDMFVEIATNGLLLNSEDKRRSLVASGVDRLLFSIHGADQESAAGYMTDVFKFDQIMDTLASLDTLRKELGASMEIYWKYLLFEWNDTDEHLGRAESLARSLGVDKLQFTLPGYPSPSKRFPGPANKNVKVVDLAKERTAKTRTSL